MLTFDWVSNKRLKRILLSDDVNKKDLAWALNLTYHAIGEDSNNEMVSFEVLKYRERSYYIADYYFGKSNIVKSLLFLKNTWRV